MVDQIRLRMYGNDGIDFCHQFFNWNFGKDEYKNIKVVSDDSYTHVAIFGISTPQLNNISKENVIGVQCEPIELNDLKSYTSYIDKNIGTYYTCDETLLKENIKFGIPFLAPYPLQLIKNSYQDQKVHKMSIIASNKTQLPGHQFRHEIIKRILNSNMDIHIFGRGIEYMYGRDSRIKGTISEKPDALIPYYYTISIENVLYKFISEKFYDPILFECIPLYCGNKIVEDICGKYKSYINIAYNNYFDIIYNIYNSPLSYYKYQIIESNIIKNKIFTFDLNMCEFIYQHFNKG